MNRFYLLPLIAGIFLCCVRLSFTQQIPVMDLSYFNPVLLNPAFLGENQLVNTFLHYRKQWCGFEGAPETFYLTNTFKGAGDKVAWGGGFFNDRVSFIGHTGFMGIYRYQLALTQVQQLSFGLEAGVVSNNIDFSRVRAGDPGDVSLLEYAERASTVDADLGIVYKNQNFYSGFSCFRLFSNSFQFQDQSGNKFLEYRLIRHFFFVSGYQVRIGTSLTYHPSIVLNSAQGTPLQFRVRNYFHLEQSFRVGLEYKSNNTVSGALGFQFDEDVLLAYSYEVLTNPSMPAMGATHELALGIAFSSLSGLKPKATSSQRSDFSSQEQWNERLMKTENELIDINKKLQKSEQEKKELKDEIDRLHEILERDKKERDALIQRESISIDSINITIEDPEQKEKRFYLVLGAYFNAQDAVFFTQILKRELGLDTEIMEREDGKYFFVFSSSFPSHKDSKKYLRKELQRLEKMNVHHYTNGNPWIYLSK